MDTLGWIFVERGLAERGVALLDRAHRARPGALETRYHLAMGLQEAGQTERARGLLVGLQSSLEPNHTLVAKVDEALRTLQ
jgi:cytochrome c-type biogenesis protein CcmH/NrfG